MPERQQLDGIRAAMASKNEPLDETTEARLLEAMYDARIEAAGQTPAGPDARDLSGHFGKILENQSELLLSKAADILSPAQVQALKDQQTQANAFQMSALKLGESMMKTQESPAK